MAYMELPKKTVLLALLKEMLPHEGPHGRGAQRLLGMARRGLFDPVGASQTAHRHTERQEILLMGLPAMGFMGLWSDRC